MNILHGLAAVALALLAAFVALFFIGSEEQQVKLVQQHFWATLSLRFLVGLLVGLSGVIGWWLLSLILARLGLGPRAGLREKMARIALGPLLGALGGALLFCAR